MIEQSPARKNKINLTDYNWQQDIENRILMSDFTALDVEALQEILFSPLKISLRKLHRTLSCEESSLAASLQKFASGGLLTINDDTITVDKEKRKYFEFQINRFDPDFKADMEFVQGLLKKVPIQLLPLWYAIPRTSNNIFESIVEKYLLTPHLFIRYLGELNLGDSLLNNVIRDLFAAPDLKISSSDLIAKYNLKRTDFEEAMLILEFNFVCCVRYEKIEDHFVEFVSPFYEWQEYLTFLKNTECQKVTGPIDNVPDSDFSFIEEMSTLLLQVRKKPLKLPKTRAVEKLVLTKLATYIDDELAILDTGDGWLDLNLEGRALHLYRHPHNRILSLPAGERYVREAEKAVKRLKSHDWVYFDDFLKGVLVPLSEHSVVCLKKVGKQWKYVLPIYNESEVALIKATVFEWLFEMGMTRTGTSQGKPCFSMTHFGRFFFEE